MEIRLPVRGRFSNFGFRFFDFPGGHAAGVTPVPIPNTEVKPRRADDTARVTVWERRSLPGLIKTKGRCPNGCRPFRFLAELSAVRSWPVTRGTRGGLFLAEGRR